MPRRLTDELNQLRIQDNISGSEILLSYRMPTTEERAAYANESFRRKGNKVETRIVATRQKFGKLILADVREGDFTVPGAAAGQDIPLVSDPASPNYDRQWKETVAAYAGDLLELLAAHVFDGSASLAPAQADGAEEDGDAAAGDLEKN